MDLQEKKRLFFLFSESVSCPIILNKYMSLIHISEVQKGKLTVELNVKKTSGFFLLDFQTEGFVIVPCDRCLDEICLLYTSKAESR